MAEYTKAQILQFIADNLPDNTTKLIHPDHLRDVLIRFTDMIQSSELISYTNQYFTSLEDVYYALNLALENNIQKWSNQDWPDSITVYHGGKLYFSTDVILQNTGEPGANPNWELLTDTSATAMTAEQIAAALNTITLLANMVTSNRVKYNTNQTVQNKIDAMDSVIAGKQGEIFSKRIIMEGEISSFSLVVTGYIHPIQVAVNRVPYVGKQGSSFAGQLAGFDFRYEQANNVTTITTNPAFNPRLTFNPGDVIDILHSTVAPRQDIDS